MSRIAFVIFCSLWLRTGPAPVPLAVLSAVPEPAVVTDPNDNLAPYLERAASSGARDREGVAELKRALGLSRAGNHAAAVKVYERAAQLAPGMADWAHVLAADAVAAAGDTTAVLDLLARTEPFLARGWGWRAVVTAKRTARDLAGATEAALAAVDAVEDPARQAQVMLTAAELFLQRRDTASALVQYRRAMDLAPMSSAGVDAARAMSALPRLGAADHGRAGRIYLRHGNVERGIAGLDRFLAAGAGTAEERARARLDIGKALFSARRHQEAERRLAPLAAESAHPALNAEASLLTGRAQFRQGRKDAARTTFERTADRFPHERGTAEALFILGDLEHDEGRTAAARRYYRRSIASHASSDEAGEAAMRLGAMALSAGDAAEAALIFEAYRSSHRGGKRYAQATYWSARAYLALRDTATGHQRLREVQAVDPTTYYGMLASDRLGAASWQAALAPSPRTAEKTRVEATGGMRRLAVLNELGLERAAAFEMERLKRYLKGHEGALYLLGEAYHQRNETFAGIRLGREIQRLEGAWNERLLRIVYPFPYREQIVREAKRKGVDPYLAAGLVRQESLFNPRAVSSAGAIGLMQVMPRTGRSLASKEGLRSVNAQTLRSPDVNVKLGMRYLSDLLGRYGGHVTYMLAAYNAGPSRVTRWRGHPEAIDADLFAERIPFAETRDYVKIVQQNARIYRALYTE